MKTLLENKASPNLKNNDGATALDLAAAKKYRDVMELLANAGGVKVRAVFCHPYGCSYILRRMHMQYRRVLHIGI